MGYFFAILALAICACGQVNVLTYQYDNSRSGLNSSEVRLNPANTNPSQFGKLFANSVDGYVYAEPLYIGGLAIPNHGTHNTVFVVTEHDSVYAFDADQAGAPLWKVSFLDAARGVTSVPSGDTGCGQITPEIGITSTPVIDLGTKTLYTVAMTKETSGNTVTYVHRLHALDLTTGAEKSGSPVVIQATVPGSADGGSTVTFVAKNYKQRPALLLLNGVVYTAWSSHCDGGKYHGWLIGYDAASLNQVSVYNNTPDGNMGSLWMAGAGPAADAAGNIYVVSGNGSFNYNAGGRNLGESFLKISTSGGLAVADWFTPFDYNALNNADLDTGSSGALLLPDSAGSSAHPHLMISAGKGAKIYLLDRDNLGKFQSGSDSQIVQSLAALSGGMFSIPAYFNGSVYLSASGDALKAFSLRNALLSTTPTSKSATSYGFPGSVPVISASGTSNGIVWVAESSSNGTLHAYDAANLATELYNSNKNSSDKLGSYVKYSVPLVVQGKVYVGTETSVVVYGLRNPPPLVVSAAGPAAAAPGSLISIYGSSLASGTAVAQSFPLQTSLAGASVSINGAAAPILYSSPGQINAQVPFETAPGSASVVVTAGGISLAASTLTIQTAAPALFTLDGSRAAAINQNGSINGASAPAPSGSIVSVYCTGLGNVDNSVRTGNAAPASPLSRAVASITATVGGQSAEVEFAGLSPGAAGLYQVNLKLPSLGAGDYPVIVTAGDKTSNSAILRISGN